MPGLGRRPASPAASDDSQFRRALPKGSRSLRNQVADALREAILRGELAPGDRLLESELSAQMQVSRGPLREALRELEREGLTTSFPYRGTVVSEFSRESVVELLMPVRVVLEQCGFRHGRSHITADSAAELEDFIRKMESAAEDGDARRVVETDLDFHRYVMHLSEQDDAYQLWASIEPRVRRFFYMSTPPNKDYLQSSAEQHRRLVEHLLAPTDAGLADAVREHIERVPGFTSTDVPAGEPTATPHRPTHVG